MDQLQRFRSVVRRPVRSKAAAAVSFGAVTQETSPANQK